jgi:mono/diheme cytochrome c family protein
MRLTLAGRQLQNDCSRAPGLTRPGAGKLFQEAQRVMSGSSSGRVLRRLALAVPLLAGALAGCGLTSERYPKDLKYLPRTDPLVIDAPKVEPWNPDNPGQLDQAIARIGVSEEKGGVGGKALDPTKLSKGDRDEVQKELGKVFNTPRSPAVEVGDSELKEYVAALQLDDDTLLQGSKHYRRHCLHCHGLDGDGRGPTGPWLNPHPRDYRQGLFKFISTDVKVKNRKPRRDDLLRTLKKGIDGTSMPSFGLQTEEELNQIVSYVIHLSLRGQVEFDTLRALIESRDEKTGNIDLSALEGGSIASHVQDRLGDILKAWARSDKSNAPPDYTYPDTDEARKASITRGYQLFADAKGVGCIKCHADFGRQVPYKYDMWGTLVRPANLTAGTYRGGRRPIDLYWRLRGGIPPSQMPEAGDIKPLAANTEPYWDLVNFIQALPYPNMLPKEVREKIYIESTAAPPVHASAE